MSFPEDVAHALEHQGLADDAAAHASTHRATIGNQSLFEVIFNGDIYKTHGPSMDQYLKAHLGFLESIAHSLVAITTELRLMRTKPF